MKLQKINDQNIENLFSLYFNYVVLNKNPTDSPQLSLISEKLKKNSYIELLKSNDSKEIYFYNNDL